MRSEEFQALLDAAADGVIVIDADGCIMTFNTAAERLFGYRAADVIGKPVDVLMPEPHRSKHAEYMRRYAATGEARIIGVGRVVQAQRADGTLFPVTLSVGEARGGDGTRFVGIVRDLSGQRSVEQRARSLEARLAHFGRYHLLGEMAAGIAHEINQPLAAIATYAQGASRILERNHPGLTKLLDICRKIDEQARRAGEVLANLRKFILKQEVESQLLDINGVIADVADFVEADAKAEGIPLQIRYGNGLPKVRADAAQLQQVILNLTRNSVEAMRDGARKEYGIEIATATTAVGGVRIGVTDHGHGVPRQLGDNIFHPFITTKRDGLGVGLAISRTIVHAYRGSLTYTDNPDGGSIFSIELPPPTEGVK